MENQFLVKKNKSKSKIIIGKYSYRDNGRAWKQISNSRKVILILFEPILYETISFTKYLKQPEACCLWI